MDRLIVIKRHGLTCIFHDEEYGCNIDENVYCPHYVNNTPFPEMCPLRTGNVTVQMEGH